MDFSQVEAEFQKLRGQLETGALTQEEFKARLADLMIQDEEGRWWMIGYETGLWYYHDGERWVRGEPPKPAVSTPRTEQEYAQGKRRAPGFPWPVATGVLGVLVLILMAFVVRSFVSQPPATLTVIAQVSPTSKATEVSVVPPTATSPATVTLVQPTTAAVPTTPKPLQPTPTITKPTEPTPTIIKPTEPTPTLDPVFSRDDRISGRFTYRGIGVPGIPVSLITGAECDVNQVTQRTTTDAQGRYYFLNVSPGSYRIAINGWNGIDTPVQPYEQTCTWELAKTSAALPLDWTLNKTDLQITFPIEKSSIGTTNPTFQWQPYPNATSYEVILIQTSPTRKTIIGLDSGNPASTDSTSFTPNLTLVPGAGYWLLVWASDANGQIAVGSVYFQVQ